MNADILSANTSKYEKQEKEPEVHHNSDDLQIQPDQTLNNLNRKSEQKRKSHINSTQPSNASPLSTKNIYSATGKHQVHKLVDNKQLSKPFNQSDKKTFLLDTYARIVATNNRRCPKRLRDLAKPKKQVSNDKSDDSTNFDLNWHTGKASTAKMKRGSENSKMKQLY
ncbi:uncharacterized protein LOC116846051 isoform X2 [Odontomachus brunneus]|uniref:uncharacterized protein LOC116846051 isoform X2 n=1 Tax=Odontomachus brunneus TaxID=486640 RepID=UPI0013F28E80|nr:uncharacterized protein LOC116846051 isoform X2 [Odontomachus brunneus]